MGDRTIEAGRLALRLDFDRRLMLQFRGAVFTSHVGLCCLIASWVTRWA